MKFIKPIGKWATKGIDPKAFVKTRMSKGGYHEKERNFKKV